MTEQEIVQALRCVGKPKPFTGENCKVCPYWAKETLVEWQQKAGWAACKVYDIPPDAADIIERLTAENADLRKEIEWKDIVIALAKKKQAEAEADHKALINELCQYCGKYKYAHEGACDGCRWKGEA